MNKQFIFVSVFFLVLLMNSFFVSALTGEIGNAKMILRPEVGLFGETIEKSIRVINSNDVPVNIVLEVGEGDNFLKIIDSEFTLQPGEEKNAEFLIKIKEAGDYTGKINVMFQPIGEQKTGVALSSQIIVHATEKKTNLGIVFLLGSFAMLIVVAVILFVKMKLKKEKTKK